MLLQKNRLLASSTFAILLAVSAAAQGMPIPTPPISFTRNYSFPPVGLAGTETLQVNVVNTAPSIAASLVPVSASCKGTISFADASGMAIGTPVPFTVVPGQIFSAPLLFSKTGYSSRGEILVSVQQSVEVSFFGACSLAISLETFDAGTGVTHALLTAPATPAGATFAVIAPIALDRP